MSLVDNIIRDLFPNGANVISYESENITLSGPKYKYISWYGVQQWYMKRDYYCFVISIWERNLGYDDYDYGNVVFQTIKKLPTPYLAALELVSNGITTDSDGRHGLIIKNDEVGSSATLDYIESNISDTNDIDRYLQLIGTTIQSKMVDEDSGFLTTRWQSAINKDEGNVPPLYSDSDLRNDIIRFSVLYGYCLNSGYEKMNELYNRSPERFTLWRYCLYKLNTDYRYDLCNNIVFRSETHGVLNYTLTYAAPIGAKLYAIAMTISHVGFSISVNDPYDKKRLTTFVLQNVDTPEYRHSIVTMKKNTTKPNTYNATFRQAHNDFNMNKITISDKVSGYYVYVVVDNKNTTNIMNKTALHVFWVEISGGN
jgi:hypothetical protein